MVGGSVIGRARGGRIRSLNGIKVIGMTGKRFVLGVRDNGHDYEAYFNKEKVGEGTYDRPKGKTRFRWGMYDGTTR